MSQSQSDQMIAALYARVSTKVQKTDLQLDECRAYAKAAGWELIEYLETESSVKRRPIFERMMQDAHQRKFQVVIAWKLDRIARSMKDFLDIALQLDKAGVRFLSVTQRMIDTDQKDPMGRFMLQLFAALAELERGIILERVAAGVKAARARGVRFGRPKKVFDRLKAQELRSQGLSIRAIARQMGVPTMTVQRVVPTNGSNPRQSDVPKASSNPPQKVKQRKQ